MYKDDHLMDVHLSAHTSYLVKLRIVLEPQTKPSRVDGQSQNPFHKVPDTPSPLARRTARPDSPRPRTPDLGTATRVKDKGNKNCLGQLDLTMPKQVKPCAANTGLSLARGA